MANDRYTIDPAHSRFTFVARHMLVAKVRGSFDKVEGYIDAPDGDASKGAIEVKIDANSLNTGVSDRDNHLRSADFFDAANHPEITFRSTKIEKDGDDYTVTGDLTMRGITKPTTLKGEVEGTVKDPWGNERVGASFSGKLNRFDWNLHWDAKIETGGLIVGDTINLEIDVEVTRPVAQGVTAEEAQATEVRAETSS